jgi:hypothetical protein
MQRKAALTQVLGASIVARRATGAWCSSGAAHIARASTRKPSNSPSVRASDHARHEAEPKHAKDHRRHPLHVARIDQAAQTVAQEHGQRRHGA